MISFSNEALASMARAGDHSAFERLLAGNRGLVVAAARKACGSRWGQLGQEAIAAAEAGLWLACQAFEPGRDNWGRLAFSTMRAEARRAIREALGPSKVRSVGGVPGEGILAQIEARQVQAFSQLEGLNQLDQQVAQELALGHSQRSIAEALGIGRQVVRTAAKRLRKGLAHA